MSSTIPSPNMSLPVPVVGVEFGPQWATDINSCMSILDGHNHTPGSGIAITPAGLNINSDLTFNSANNAIAMRSARFTSQAAPLSAGTDIGCLYESGVDLYFNDGGGNQIRITQSGSVAGSAGTITGLPSGTASAAFASGSGSFVFLQATSTAANFDVGSIAIRYPGSYPTPSGNYIQLQAPTSLATGFSVTLPAALPASASPMVMDSSGNISVSPSIYASFVPTGGTLIWFGTSAPTGFLMCVGTAVSRSTYSALFGVIGTACGSGDGSTTFNLPDLRGYFLRGTDGTDGRDPDSASRTAMQPGGNTGDNVGSVQGYTVQSHSHSYQFPAAGAGNNINVSGSAGSTGLSTGTTGGNETRPINAYCNYIIKT